MTPTLPFHYRIRRSQRATHARIVVKPGQVEVVAPWQIPDHKLHKFIQTKQEWVTHALRKMAAANPGQSGFAPKEYKTGETISYLGENHALTVLPTSLKRVKIEFKENFIVHVPQSSNSDDHTSLIKQALVSWLKKQAKALVEELVQLHAPAKNLHPRSITIKTQKSRWGSCGIHNDININWLLLLAPKTVLEYVVVHELCHIKEKNHSARFWALVGEHLPDYHTRRQWLKRNGRGLMMAFAD